MAILGVPYDVMYLSRGRSGLTNVVFFVRKPDGSQVGPFPMSEEGGPFSQSYFGQFYSSIDDPQGKYFGKVISPSEGVVDNIAFELTKPGGDAGEAQFFIPPSNLKAIVRNSKMNLRFRTSPEVTLSVESSDVKLRVWEEISVSAEVESANVVAKVTAADVNLEVEGC